jgi:hypothetical protein
LRLRFARVGRLGEAIDWLARCRDLRDRHVIVGEILAFRRVRRDSLSNNRDAAGERGNLLAVRRALLRKKQMQDVKDAS